MTCMRARACLRGHACKGMRVRTCVGQDVCEDMRADVCEHMLYEGMLAMRSRPMLTRIRTALF